jgi:hypothetical protein
MVSEERRRDYGKEKAIEGLFAGDAIDGGDGAVGMGTYQGGAHLGGCARGDDLDLNGGERGHGTRFAAESAARAAVVAINTKASPDGVVKLLGQIFILGAAEPVFRCFPDRFS